MYAPLGPAPHEWVKELTIRSANQTFPFIEHLLECIDGRRVKEMTAATFCSAPSHKQHASRLKSLFDRYGSDKSTTHNYHYIYGPILKAPDDVTAVLEIGLGTNNLDVASNMGEAGRPGASLRAFRDFLPNANIYGADIDKRILFKEDRIETFFVDQTDLTSFDSLATITGEMFDLIIDDGLHAPNANIAVLAFGIRRIKVGGWIIIEDIRPDAIPIWHTVGALLPAKFTSYVFSTQMGPVFGVQRVE